MMGIDRFVAEGIRAARRLVVGVVGLTVLAVGLALIVLPGPAFVVIPVGLGILAIEFEWARRLLRRARRLYAAAAPGGGRPAPDGETAEEEGARGPDAPPAARTSASPGEPPPQASSDAGGQKP